MSSVPQIPPPDPRKRPGRYVLFAAEVPGGWRPADPHELPDVISGGTRLAGGLTLAKAVQTAGFYNAHAAAGQRIVVIALAIAGLEAAKQFIEEQAAV